MPRSSLPVSIMPSAFSRLASGKSGFATSAGAHSCPPRSRPAAWLRRRRWRHWFERRSTVWLVSGGSVGRPARPPGIAPPSRRGWFRAGPRAKELKIEKIQPVTDPTTASRTLRTTCLCLNFNIAIQPSNTACNHTTKYSCVNPRNFGRIARLRRSFMELAAGTAPQSSTRRRLKAGFFPRPCVKVSFDLCAKNRYL